MTKTLQQFCIDALNAGQYANPQSGTYPGQCVSFVQQYLWQCFGVPYEPRGNAKDFMPPGFHRVNKPPQKGDIIRYGANYGGGYGHVGIIADDGQFMDQNGVKSLAIGKRATPWPNYESVWRPNDGIKIYNDAPVGSNPWDTTAIPAGATPESATFTASVDRYIRRQPNLSGEIVGTFTAGASQKYDCKVAADGFMWVGWNGASGHRSWSAVRRLSDNKRYGTCK